MSLQEKLKWIESVITKEDEEITRSGIWREKENFELRLELYRKYGMEIRAFGLTYQPKEGKTYTVTITEAVDFFENRYSRTTITDWVVSGYIEAIKVGRKWVLNYESMKEAKEWDRQQDLEQGLTKYER